MALKNETWDIVWKPKGNIQVEYKWVFTVKYKVDGPINHYKTRLVVNEYTQTYRINHQETFVLVVKINTI